MKPNAIYPYLVKRGAGTTRAGAGPSGLDADGWRRILMEKEFGNSSIDLCTAIAEVIKKQCTADNLSPSLEEFLVCHLIPLDKSPGLGPVGIGEILHWIVTLTANFRFSF